MKKRTKVLLMMFSLALLLGVIWFSSGPVAKSKAPFSPGSLEEKARKAKGGDEDAVRDVTDQIFYLYGQVLPPEVADEVKERVVRAEIDYQKNRKGGVRETNVVEAVNFLAEKFHAPDFAKTDHRQVKVLRARLKSQAPSFFAPDAENKKGLKKKLGEPMNPEVSPLEATGLTLAMLTQKVLNDEYQQTPKEFAIRTCRKASWLEVDREGPAYAVVPPRQAEKRSAAIHVVVEGLKHMSIADAIYLADGALDKLGIKK